MPKKEHLVEGDTGEMVPIQFTAVELPLPVSGAHKQNELREYSKTLVKKEQYLSIGIQIMRV